LFDSAAHHQPPMRSLRAAGPCMSESHSLYSCGVFTPAPGGGGSLSTPTSSLPRFLALPPLDLASREHAHVPAAMLSYMPMLVLTSKLVPPGLEATTYALLAGGSGLGLPRVLPRKPGRPDSGPKWHKAAVSRTHLQQCSRIGCQRLGLNAVGVVGNLPFDCGPRHTSVSSCRLPELRQYRLQPGFTITMHCPLLL
jgi:hypothetical protein